LAKSQKLYYSITEVAEMAQVKPHVLRYWETEFSLLRPRKNRAGNRVYRERDVRLVLMIRQLLYDEGFTIRGARKKLRETKSSEMEQIEIPFGTVERQEAFKQLRRELEQILQDLAV
jgi:DNA-binding transcriptional MerR regulator